MSHEQKGNKEKKTFLTFLTLLCDYARNTCDEKKNAKKMNHTNVSQTEPELT